MSSAKLSARELAIRMIVDAIVEAIRDARQIPSGHLYAVVMGHLSLNQYTTIINVLKEANLVNESNHLLTWIGPAAPCNDAHDQQLQQWADDGGPTC